jgi:hypothetical protein
MKNYILFTLIFVSFLSLAYSGLYERDLLGGTQLNGSGCVCHTIEQDTSVSVWIEGPDTLVMGQTGLYRMYLANGPAEAGGHNVAGRYGVMSLVDSLSVWDSRSPNELTQAFPLLFPTPQDTIYWEFAYTAPDSVVIDTIYSCGLSIVYDHIPDFHDRWNYGPKFPVHIVESIVPVELISFSASVVDDDVMLKWNTATETNNTGFEIQRKQVFSPQSSVGKNEWNSLSFIYGNGTTTESHTYSFMDDNLIAGKYHYRLKQIDFNGEFNYSNIIEISVNSPNRFMLKQNYPNPFNPSTIIRYSIPDIISSEGSNENVSLTVYDVLGNEVIKLIDEKKYAGEYEVEFNTSSVNSSIVSGVYFYQLKVGKFVQTKKMLLIK